MKPAAFAYRRAANAAHAIQLLQEYGPDARLLAGGQSLVAMMNFRFARPTALIDLSGCTDLVGVTLSAMHLHIGAITRQTDTERDPLVRLHCPLICEALAQAGPRTIRNRGTVGGSIANAYPTAHLLAVAACLNAEMVIESMGQTRIVRAHQFFQGAFTTALAPDELLREVRFPRCPPGSRHVFVQMGNHTSGSAAVMMAGYVEVPANNSACLQIAIAGLNDVPMRLHHVETALAEQSDASALELAWQKDMAACTEGPGDDDTLPYRQAIARGMLDDVIGTLCRTAEKGTA